MKKILVVDTNVFVSNPCALDDFLSEGNVVYIPYEVLEELDNLKRRMDLTASIARFFENLESHGSNENLRFHSYNVIPDKYLKKLNAFHFDVIDSDPTSDWQLSSQDNKILLTFLNIADKHPASEYCQAVMVSNDRSLRAKINTYCKRAFPYVIAEPYKKSRVDDTSFYSEMRVIELDSEAAQILNQPHEVDELPDEIRLYPNECALFDFGDGDTYLYQGMPDGRVQQNYAYKRIRDVKPKNPQQMALMNLLMGPQVQCVAASGPQGTGKTFLAIAAALALIEDESTPYKKIILSRAIASMGGHELGFLPGTLMDKLRPWLAPFKDAIEILRGDNVKGRKGNNRVDMLEELIEFGKIEVESLEHIRGRSFRECIVIIDESQDTKPSDMKTIVTRMGTDSKLFLLGDPRQIDSRYLDLTNNGLSHVIHGLRGSVHFGHVYLSEVLRSGLAREAVLRL